MKDIGSAIDGSSFQDVDDMLSSLKKDVCITSDQYNQRLREIKWSAVMNHPCTSYSSPQMMDLRMIDDFENKFRVVKDLDVDIPIHSQRGIVNDEKTGNEEVDEQTGNEKVDVQMGNEVDEQMRNGVVDEQVTNDVDDEQTGNEVDEQAGHGVVDEQVAKECSKCEDPIG